jgi:hypothetical protein
MEKPEEEYLLELWERNICPFCGNFIPEGTRVGRGKKRLGGFCSLDCLARYYERELADRAVLLSAAFKRHQTS